jgi:hypothetical protein
VRFHAQRNNRYSRAGRQTTRVRVNLMERLQKIFIYPEKRGCLIILISRFGGRIGMLPVGRRASSTQTYASVVLTC